MLERIFDGTDFNVEDGAIDYLFKTFKGHPRKILITCSRAFDSLEESRTPETVYMGFGFEAIDNADDRKDLMDSVMKYMGQ